MYLIIIGTAEESKSAKRFLMREKRINVERISETCPDRKWENHFRTTAIIRKRNKIVDGIINIVADILAFPSETIRINGRELPYEVVRDRLIRIDFTVLSYTVQKLSKVGSDIFSGTNYILTALYNALDTIDFNFQAEVNRS